MGRGARGWWPPRLVWLPGEPSGVHPGVQALRRPQVGASPCTQHGGILSLARGRGGTKLVRPGQEAMAQDAPWVEAQGAPWAEAQGAPWVAEPGAPWMQAPSAPGSGAPSAPGVAQPRCPGAVALKAPSVLMPMLPEGLPPGEVSRGGY